MRAPRPAAHDGSVPRTPGAAQPSRQEPIHVSPLDAPAVPLAACRSTVRRAAASSRRAVPGARPGVPARLRRLARAPRRPVLPDRPGAGTAPDRAARRRAPAGAPGRDRGGRRGGLAAIGREPMAPPARRTQVNRTATLMNRVRAAIPLLGLALALGLLPLAPPPAAAAATFVVNRTTDQPDPNLGDGRCDVAPAVDGDQCTLRAAIQQANQTAGANTIAFAIPGPGVHTSAPTSALPEVGGQVTIDGYTQPGAAPNTLTKGTNAALRVQLDGSNAGAANGLVLQGLDSAVKGLTINRFANSGVR